MSRWFLALGLLAACTVLSFADEKEADKKSPQVHVVSLAVYKAQPAKLGSFFMIPDGIHLEVIVSLPDRYISGLDAKGSKLDSFTDDKGHVLFKKERGFFGKESTWLHEPGIQIGPEGEAVILPIQGTNAPGKGAAKILVKGSLNIKCGSKAKTTEAKELIVKPREQIEVGAFKVRVNDMWGDIQVLSKEENIKQVEFSDDKGKAIMSSRRPSRVRMPTDKPQVTYVVYSYNLVRRQEKVSLKIHYFSEVETVNVPLDLSVGLGLE